MWQSMRLLTAGSSVRAGHQEPEKLIDMRFIGFFLYLNEQFNAVSIYVCLHLSVNPKTKVFSVHKYKYIECMAVVSFQDLNFI